MLKEKIKQDLKKALKEQKKEQALVLRGLLASLLNAEKEKRYGLSKQDSGLSEKELEEKSQLNDEETTKVIFSEAKKRKEAMVEFERGGRQDLVDKEKRELTVLQAYLPQQASEQEIRQRAEEIVKELGASGPQDLGKVMGRLMAEFKNKAEGQLIAQIVKQVLSQND
jgi:hypothetical protein